MADQTNTSDAPPRTSKRRALFSGAAGLGAVAALATGVVVPARAIGADAELLELCAAWYPANDRYVSVGDRLADLHEDDQSAADRALMKEVHRVVHDFEHRIFDTPATTLAGLKAKAEILAFMGNEMGVPVNSPHGWSLVQDIIALGSAA